MRYAPGSAPALMMWRPTRLGGQQNRAREVCTGCSILSYPHRIRCEYCRSSTADAPQCKPHAFQKRRGGESPSLMVPLPAAASMAPQAGRA